MVILLIEPDIRLAGLYRRALEQAGHDVSWARQAQSAVHAADDKKPDLVLLELQLSAHNGIEFLYEFRSYTEWQDIRVMLLTMVTPDAILITKSQMKSLGIVGILYKPATNLAQLVAAVSNTQ